MSVAVGLEELWGKIDEVGGDPYLVTATAGGRPHLVSVRARVEDGRIVVSAGSTTRGNVAANGAASLLWPAPPGEDYSLIVDGTGTADDSAEEVAVTPTRAVLHRVASVTKDIPSCVKILSDK